MTKPCSELIMLCACLLASTCNCLKVEIDTDQGKIHGIQMTARNGDKFFGFYGIPYAHPPVGQMRFANPVPKDIWQGSLDATKEPDVCLQNSHNDPSEIVGSEDCLYLNVFTKHPGVVHANKQVLVWIHGGAFIFGGADLYRPDYILEEDVVLVVIQYRLNIFGYLSDESESLPGNYGSMDQVEALRWVRRYIHSYGGDYESVTVFGMSAGGASIHYLVLSPLTTGLFKNAISFSGSALDWWANIPGPKKFADRLSIHFNCGSEQLRDCLRKLHPRDLIKAHRLFFDWRADKPEREPMNVFSPRSDPEAETPFMPEHPWTAMKKGNFNKVPYMVGLTEKEGIWRANYILPDDDKGELWKEFVKNFRTLAPLAFGLKNQTENEQEVLDSIVDFYELDNLEPVTEVVVLNYVDAQSDSMFNYGIDTTAKLMAPETDLFFYFLKYPAKHSLANFRINHSIGKPKYEALKLASHGTDMLLLFNMFPNFGPMPEKDVEVSREFVKLVVDFAKHGKSTLYPDWKELDVDDPKILVINEKFEVKKGLPFQDRIDFWKTLDVYWKYNLKSESKEKKVKEEL